MGEGDETKTFEEPMGDETGSKDLRKLELAEIGEPIRAERKEDKSEAGAVR